MPEVRLERKDDKIIWYVMITSISIIILGGGAWATSINTRVEKIASMEANIQYIQNDISDIKSLIKSFIKRGE